MPRKTMYYETGPNWEMVEEWIKSLQDTTKRKVTITLGYHEFRNGYSGLFVSCESEKRDAKARSMWQHETCWYWPNKRYVSLPAMVVGLITAHEREIEGRTFVGDENWEPRGVEELPLFKSTT